MTKKLNPKPKPTAMDVNAHWAKEQHAAASEGSLMRQWPGDGGYRIRGCNGWISDWKLSWCQYIKNGNCIPSA